MHQHLVVEHDGLSLHNASLGREHAADIGHPVFSRLNVPRERVAERVDDLNRSLHIAARRLQVTHSIVEKPECVENIARRL